jgi:hypothetical protein
MPSKPTKIERHPQAAWQAVNDRMLVVTPQTKKIHILSGTGSRIWEFLSEPREVSKIIKMICDEFAVSQIQAGEDVDLFLHDLEKRELIRCQ